MQSTDTISQFIYIHSSNAKPTYLIGIAISCYNHASLV